MALGAYQSEVGRGNLLSTLAHPTVVNPLAAQNEAYQVFGNQMRAREAIAQNALGQAYQQATDPQTGQVNYDQFRRLAAGDPRTAMGIQNALPVAQRLDTEQYNLRMSQLGNFTTTAGQLLADYPHGVPQEAVNGVIDRAVANGSIPQSQADVWRAQFGTDPIKNAQVITQGLFHGLNSQAALNAARPGTGTVDTGQGVVGTTQTPQGSVLGQPGALSTSGSRINTGLPSVSQMLGQVGQKVFGDDAKRLGVPDGTEVTIPMVQRWVQQGAGGLVTHGVPGGQTAAPAPGGAPGAPPPPPPGTQLRTGYQPRPGAAATPPGAGTQLPQPPAAAQPPGQPPTAPTAPGAPGAASTATPAPAAPAPGASGGFKPVVTNVPGGEEDIQQYKAAQADMPNQQRNLVAGQTALEALRLARTGPGTDTVNRMKAFLLSQGIDMGQIDPNSTEAYQLARKNLLRFAQSSGARVGTDLGLTTQLESNANVDTMLNSANEHILKQDMGLARQRVAQTLEAPPGGVGMGKHVQNFTNDTDPRGFAWDLYTPDERNKIVADAAKTKGGLDKLDRAIEIAAKHGLIRVPQQTSAQQ